MAMLTKFTAAAGSMVLILGLVPGPCRAQPGPAAGPAPAPEAAPPRPMVLTEGLAIEGVATGGRWAASADALLAAWIGGAFDPATARAGDTITLPDGTVRTWKALRAAGQGVFAPAEMRRGYLLVRVESERARTMLLEASGHTMVYVDGAPRVGDPYGNGTVRLPVALRQGVSTLLFAPAGRGNLTARLVPLPEFGGPAYFLPGDDTLPDVLGVGGGTVTLATLVMNTSDRPIAVVVESSGPEQGAPIRGEPVTVPPLSVRKVAVTAAPGVSAEPAARKIELRAFAGPVGGQAAAAPSDTATLTLRSRDEYTQPHKRTFVSGIDGSVQYYAVRPGPRRPVSRSERQPSLPLIVSLHGASVEAIGQAEAYGPAGFADIVCPTNRRPFGFDWEDWGRLDAYEVIRDFERHGFAAPQPERVYLTGHSMGGHGTWQLGVLDPGRWAGIGPSAGWASFSTYTGAGQTDPMGETWGPIFRRAGASSDTLALISNLADVPVYILHGQKDDNVPLSEARRMAEALKPFHADWRIFEQPDAGHWWDQGQFGPEPGAACVDWPPMMDLFRARRNEPPATLTFATVNPAIASRRHWAVIEQQFAPGVVSSVSLTRLAASGRVSGTTANVSALTLEFPGRAEPVRVEIDGTTLEGLTLSDGAVTLRRAAADGPWSAGPRPGPGEKNPGRSGPFKHAFNQRFILVYGTGGGPETQAWMLAKARFDAEQWWYRGNGSCDVMSDAQYMLSRPEGRSVILYGNADSNTAWAALMADSPVQVRDGGVSIGERLITGNDLACLVCRPHPASPDAMVALVGGTGPAGMRLTERLPYFSSGVAYPDLTVLGPGVLASPAGGVRAAGFFGADWSLRGAEITIAP
ncbi:MAG: prolyl oligopeptidase family serine peptidase [Phycisphaeraceae bacterium]|nr:prolyl oligopeptidase family serine peptidase [Phycisphaeraceae bacterium]